MFPWYSQEQVNFTYRRLVPGRYWQTSGLYGYDFNVLRPWHRSFHIATDPKGEMVSFPESATCGLRIGEQSAKKILIPRKDAPQEFEAVILVGKALFSRWRVEKYMTVYKAYECLNTWRNPMFSAIRHGLSHPSSILTEPRTISTLNQLFGTTTIDLGRNSHLRVFYKHLGMLLKENDDLLHSKLMHRMEQWPTFGEDFTLLFD